MLRTLFSGPSITTDSVCNSLESHEFPCLAGLPCHVMAATHQAAMERKSFQLSLRSVCVCVCVSLYRGYLLCLWTSLLQCTHSRAQ